MPRCEAVSNMPGFEWRCNRNAGHTGAHKAYDPASGARVVSGCFVAPDPISERTKIEWAEVPDLMANLERSIAAGLEAHRKRFETRGENDG